MLPGQYEHKHITAAPTEKRAEKYAREIITAGVFPDLTPEAMTRHETDFKHGMGLVPDDILKALDLGTNASWATVWQRLQAFTPAERQPENKKNIERMNFLIAQAKKNRPGIADIHETAVLMAKLQSTLPSVPVAMAQALNLPDRASWYGVNVRLWEHGLLTIKPPKPEAKKK